MFLWVLLGVVLVLTLVWIAQVAAERRRLAAAVAEPARAAPRTREHARHRSPDDAQLAANGDFTSAIHAVLLRLLASYADQLHPAWTSREAARRIDREEFNRLVELVERTLFGGRQATREHYEAARAWAHALRPGSFA